MTKSGSEPFLLWVNPDDINDNKDYVVDATNTEDPVVGAFTTKLLETSNDTIISTATIKELNLTDIMSAGISCRDGIGNNSTMYVADLGKKNFLNLNFVITMT